MAVGAVTFDFHDTLVHCDRWFELEVRDLVPSFLRWSAENTGRRADGNVLRDAAAAYRRLRLEIMEHGRESSAEACVAHILGQIGIDVGADEISQGIESLMRDRLHCVEPVPGALELVDELRAAGVPLGVVSSAVYHPFLEWSLARLGLEDAFGTVTTSASAGVYKSRPEIYWRALRELGARAERSIHIGDSHRFDVLGARRAGMRTVWLRRQEMDAPVEEPADLTIPSLERVAPRVLSLLAA